MFNGTVEMRNVAAVPRSTHQWKSDGRLHEDEKVRSSRAAAAVLVTTIARMASAK